MQRSPAIIHDIRQKSAHRSSPAMDALINKIMSRHGEAVQAILYYGSCLRKGNEQDGIVDLYVLVDTYRSAFHKYWLAILNKLLPPNVFYLEVPFKDGVVRAKYAVLSLADFQNGTSMRWFHSYLWGRFAQPVAVPFVRNEEVAVQIQQALAQAVVTFLTRVLPRSNPEFGARQLWCTGLALSYRAELRAERKNKVFELFDTAAQHYERITRSAMAAVPFEIKINDRIDPVRYHAIISPRVRFTSRLTWRLRSYQGKILSILRLLKGLLTFEGGVDYILWKIKRHSGVTVEVEPRLRRHPLLAIWVLPWRLFRRGGFR